MSFSKKQNYQQQQEEEEKEEKEPQDVINKASYFVNNYKEQLEKEEQIVNEKLSQPPVEILPHVIKSTYIGGIVGLVTGTLFGYANAYSFELRPPLARKHILYTIGRNCGLAVLSFSTYTIVEKLQQKYMKRYNQPRVQKQVSSRGYAAGGAAGLVWAVASNNRDPRFMLACSLASGVVFGSLHSLRHRE